MFFSDVILMENSRVSSSNSSIGSSSNNSISSSSHVLGILVVVVIHNSSSNSIKIANNSAGSFLDWMRMFLYFQLFTGNVMLAI